MFDTLIQTARRLPPVSPDTLRALQRAGAEVAGRVDRALSSRGDTHALTGGRVDAMRLNHRHHLGFMHQVLDLGEYAILARTLPWVYRAYRGMGFQPDYFAIELRAWLSAFHSVLPAEAVAELEPVYRWMIDSHPLILGASAEPAARPAAPAGLEGPVDGLEEALLEGDATLALALMRNVLDVSDRMTLYGRVIPTAMARVGVRWENGAIDVATEHLATATLQRALPFVLFDPPPLPAHRGRALVTASVNELHAVGAWLVANAFERDGWDVRLLGANTPVDDVVAMVRRYEPRFVAVSVALLQNLAAVVELTERLARLPEPPKVMLGGQLIQRIPELGERLAADAVPQDLPEAVRVAAEW